MDETTSTKENNSKIFQKSRKLAIGGKGCVQRLEIGGGAPVSIQTMWKEDLSTADLNAVASKLESLQAIGCDIVRFAVPNQDVAEKLVKLSYLTSMPLVADIHFDYSLALLCMDGNVAKVRINPGNIGKRENVAKVVAKAKAEGVALRIGVNSGSLPKDLRLYLDELKAEPARSHNVTKYGVAVPIFQTMPARKSSYNMEDFDKGFLQAKADVMAEAAIRELEVLDELAFDSALVSIKASGVRETILANEAFRRKRSEPLHLGVTEAGPLVSGIVKSTLAFSSLLSEGIGDTVRVSLSDSIENEVIAAREILAECGARSASVRIVSCPRCGRRGFDVHAFLGRWQEKLLCIKKNATVAVMGCVVNGPGEAREADIGITGSPETVVIFRRGKPVRTIQLKEMSFEKREKMIDEAFEKELEEL